MNKKNGIVAFFDILGYQNIIINNDVEQVANIITETILELPIKVQSGIKEMLTRSSSIINDNKKNELVYKVINDIDFLIVSDSILIFLPVDDASFDEWSNIYWGLFFFYCCFLLNESFVKGLPLRGAIEYGEYFRKENCFAGKSIINSYVQANELEFSGCVICDNAALKIKPMLNEELIGIFAFEYLAPLKNNLEKRMIFLNWIAYRSKRTFFDVRQFTIESFHSHNKDISNRVLNKLNNTEKIIRYCLILNERRHNEKRTAHDAT